MGFFFLFYLTDIHMLYVCTVHEEFEMSETMEEGMDVPAYSVVVKVPEKQINGGYTKDDEGQMIVEETDDGSTA